MATHWAKRILWHTVLSNPSDLVDPPSCRTRLDDDDSEKILVHADPTDDDDGDICRLGQHDDTPGQRGRVPHRMKQNISVLKSFRSPVG